MHRAGRVEAFDTRQPDWQQGVLIVENRALGAVLRELDRYRPGVLRWDPALERLAVTGTFRLEDTDKTLALLAASLPIEVHYRTRYWVSLVPRPPLAEGCPFFRLACHHRQQNEKRASDVLVPSFRPFAMPLLLALAAPALPRPAGPMTARAAATIPAGSLGTALTRFAGEAGVSLSVDPALVSGAAAPG